jgi:hypothetical protein
MASLIPLNQCTGANNELAGRHCQRQTDGLWRPHCYHLADAALLLPGFCGAGVPARCSTSDRDAASLAHSARRTVCDKNSCGHAGANADQVDSTHLDPGTCGEQDPDTQPSAHRDARYTHHRPTQRNADAYDRAGIANRDTTERNAYGNGDQHPAYANGNSHGNERTTYEHADCHSDKHSVADAPANSRPTAALRGRESPTD